MVMAPKTDKTLLLVVRMTTESGRLIDTAESMSAGKLLFFHMFISEIC